jgi:hypothetical protein
VVVEGTKDQVSITVDVQLMPATLALWLLIAHPDINQG